ncbi:MAG: hypothetical protein QM736_20570 [Vicinamibacterales bacterium]
MPQYTFVSPGAAASDAIERLLLQRTAQQRQQMLDALNTRNVESQMDDRALNREIQQANLASLADQRQMAGDARAVDLATHVAGTLAPDQTLDEDTAATLRKGHLGSLVAPGQEIGGTLPPEMGEGPTIAPGPETFRGTAAQRKTIEDRQRAEAYLASLDPTSREAQALQYELNTGKSAPAGMFDPKAGSTDIANYTLYADQTKAAGKEPKSFEQWQIDEANRRDPLRGPSRRS